jgi:hypothetical protein
MLPLHHPSHEEKGTISKLLFLRRIFTFEPSTSLNLALKPIGIVTLPLESTLEIALKEFSLSLVN